MVVQGLSFVLSATMRACHCLLSCYSVLLPLMVDKACLVLGIETTTGCNTAQPVPPRPYSLSLFAFIFLTFSGSSASAFSLPTFVSTMAFHSSRSGAVFLQSSSILHLFRSLATMSAPCIFHPRLLACLHPICIPIVPWVCFVHPFLLCVPDLILILLFLTIVSTVSMLALA